MQTPSTLTMDKAFFARPNHQRVLRMTREMFGLTCLAQRTTPSPSPTDNLDPEPVTVELGPWQPLHADMVVHQLLTLRMTEAEGTPATLYLRATRLDTPASA